MRAIQIISIIVLLVSTAINIDSFIKNMEATKKYYKIIEKEKEYFDEITKKEGEN